MRKRTFAPNPEMYLRWGPTALFILASGVFWASEYRRMKGQR